jgi:hypothetical protein
MRNTLRAGRRTKPVAALVGALLLALPVGADVVTEKPASILIFPKVISDGTSDTVIQITNISNSLVHARCFYVDARLPSFCNGIENPLIGCTPSWQETDFTIWLTKQQPTHWAVSEGRPIDPSDDYSDNQDGAGLDPGAVPPVTDGFVGELLCVQVMADGTPVGGNSLKGEATLVTPDEPGNPDDGDVSKYNAVGILGSNLVGATGNTLLLNRPRDGSREGEYNACPAVLLLNHFTDGASDPISGDTIVTELTVVPCSQDFETQTPSKVTLQFAIYNEYEERFSASTTVTCWKTVRLADIDSPNDPGNSVFSKAVLGTGVAHTRITPADPTDGSFNGAVVGVAEARRDGSGRSTVNIHTEGDRFTGTDGGAFDQIVLPELF